jgi:arsenate reductase
MSVTIYHNPRCSKSRETLSLLQGKGIEIKIIEYLTAPPDAATLADILDKLGLQPLGLMRRKELAFKDLGLADEGKSRDDLIQAMVNHPILIERPIVLSGDKAVLGRPPEAVLTIL